MDFFPAKESVPFAILANSKICSNSEGNDWTMCERRHFYHHVLNLEPREQGFGYYRGTIGHEALAAFYNAMKDGKKKNDCLDAAMEPINQAQARALLEFNYERSSILVGLRSLITQYIMHFWGEPLQVLEVETVHIVPTPVESIYYGLRLDLLVEWFESPYKNEIVLLDHKFTYNFRSPTMRKLNPQLPKYMAALRSEGYPVRYAWLNQVRYRPLKDPTPNDIFRRALVAPTDEHLEYFIKEHFELSLRIRERKALPVEVQDRMAVRVRTQAICEKCPFQKICIAEDETGSAIQGSQYSKDVIKYYYQPSTYESQRYGREEEYDAA